MDKGIDSDRCSGKQFPVFSGVYCGVVSIHEHLQQIVDGDKVQLYGFWVESSVAG